MIEERRPRIVRCTIEMELVEFEHFNVFEDTLTDDEVIKYAEISFEEMIANGGLDLSDWIQSKIIEDNS